MSAPDSKTIEMQVKELYSSALAATQPRSNEFETVPFLKTMLENLRDGVIFVDSNGKINLFSHAVEDMTGISSKHILGMQLAPSLLNLSDVNGQAIEHEACPLQKCLRTQKSQTGEYRIVGRSGRETKVELNFTPVVASHGTLLGAVVFLQDSSIQTDLKRQLKDLYEFSMLDALTQVANRSEFERVLDQYVRANHLSDFECSIIICDIDFFKSINDNYNHHIGDQALVSFAKLLKQFVRSQDLVARFGGEEFVILCGDCDRDSAIQRAEEIRATLTKTPQTMLDGKCITASFGVAELQTNESATEFFVRADTALLKAKELGRNRVVAATNDTTSQDPTLSAAESSSLSGCSWRSLKGQHLICEEFITSTPVSVLVEKLRGYIMESDAEIRCVEPDYANLFVQIDDDRNLARKGNFVIDIEFQERTPESHDKTSGRRLKTFIRVIVREGKKKWFSNNANDLAPLALREIRRYFMISDESAKLQVDPAVTQSTRD